MEKGFSYRWRHIALWALLVALGSAIPGAAQTISGRARAVQTSIVTPLGTTTTVLADTGPLAGADDAKEASTATGSVLPVVTGNTLHASTISWPDQVSSEASLSGLAVTVGAITIGADFVMARASAVLGQAGAGTVDIDGLTINGLVIPISGNVNQTVTILGGRVVINERVASATGTVVNALHIVVTGVADVVVASATAGIQ